MRPQTRRYEVYLLLLVQSTNTDAEGVVQELEQDEVGNMASSSIENDLLMVPL